MPDYSDQDTAPDSRRLDIPKAAMFVTITVAVVAWRSPLAFWSILLDGLPALLVTLPPMLAGLWLVPLFCRGAMPLRWHLLLGAALGLGATSLLILLLGWAGVLHRPVWVVIVALLAAFGVVRLRMLVSRPPGPVSRKVSLPLFPPYQGGTEGDRSPGTDFPRPRCASYLWLLAAPFLGLALVAATNAPGFLWSEEGYGYDVLEYHLQMPKEYHHAGRIAYAPHNVYASFPANVEMLYLLGMIVLDDDVDAGTTAHFIHLIFAIAAVFGAWTIGRDWSSLAGIVCGVMTATTGWLCYLSGLAYVENGLLFFGFVATGCIIRSLRAAGEAAPTSITGSGAPSSSLGWIVIAGLAAGFACGCKYTAVPMIALPLAVAVLAVPGRGAARRLTTALAFSAAALASFLPWLVKNQVMTGNPVFPLANGWFEASPPGWGVEQTGQWDRGHEPSPNETGVAAKATALWRHIPADHLQRFGPVVLLLAMGGLFVRRLDRIDAALLILLGTQLGVWLFATHLYARFAVILLIPLSLLAGRAALGERRSRGVVVVSCVILAGVWNFSFAARLHDRESPGAAPASLIYDGHVTGYEYFATVNHDLPDKARLLLVGEARAFYFLRPADYTVVFNEDPFIQAVRDARSDRAIVDWLIERGITHVLVHWSEIDRLLRSQYGFDPEITPALFDRLTLLGLGVVKAFEHPSGTHKGRYVTLYVVPSAGDAAAPQMDRTDGNGRSTQTP